MESLKQQLEEEYGLPACLQRLLHDGAVLDDRVKLDSLGDVKLLLLSSGRPLGNDPFCLIGFKRTP